MYCKCYLLIRKHNKHVTFHHGSHSNKCMITMFTGPNLSSILHHRWHSVNVTLFLRLLVEVWCFGFAAGLYSQVYPARLVRCNTRLAQQVPTLTCLKYFFHSKNCLGYLLFHPLSIRHRKSSNIFFFNKAEDGALSIENRLTEIVFALGQFHQMWRNINATEQLSEVSKQALPQRLMAVVELQLGPLFQS